MSRFTWTPEAVARLRELYPDGATADVAAALGCSVRGVHYKAHALGLRKTQAFLDSARSGRIEKARKDPRLMATQFRHGGEPWNKGRPGTTGLHPNCRTNQFKPKRPEECRNYKPIGSVRLDKSGNLERKVTDDRSRPSSRRWTAVHRLVWEAANGPVPAGHIVVFRRGQRTAVEAEITLHRLELISRAENARRNHPMNRSPEFAKITQLRGAITRQVNRIIRESQK